MSDTRKAIIRTTHHGVPIELEVHPDDVGAALDSMEGSILRSRSRGRRGGIRPPPPGGVSAPSGAPTSIVPTTDEIREYLRVHRDANVAEIGKALLGGRTIRAQKDKSEYDAIYIRMVTAKKHLKRESGSESARTPEPSTKQSTDRGSTITDQTSEQAAVTAVEAVTTEAAVKYVQAHPKATMKEFAPAMVGIPLKLSGSTAKAYRIASNKLWYARKKLGVRSPIPAVGGRQ
jgi:hypothetical protein